MRCPSVLVSKNESRGGPHMWERWAKMKRVGSDQNLELPARTRSVTCLMGFSLERNHIIILLLRSSRRPHVIAFTDTGLPAVNIDCVHMPYALCSIILLAALRTIDINDSDMSSVASRPKNAMHWFRKGLRLTDNPSLMSCLEQTQESSAFYPVYVMDGNSYQLLRCSPLKANFLVESLQDLDNKACLQWLQS